MVVRLLHHCYYVILFHINLLKPESVQFFFGVFFFLNLVIVLCNNVQTEYLSTYSWSVVSIATLAYFPHCIQIQQNPVAFRCVLKLVGVLPDSFLPQIQHVGLQLGKLFPV